LNAFSVEFVPRSFFMKQVAAILFLVAAPALFAQPKQATTPDAAPQAGDNTSRSSSGQATAHDKHTRKHRTGHHHRRHHATAKSHNNA
jgi:hypothetical protein